MYSGHQKHDGKITGPAPKKHLGHLKPNCSGIQVLSPREQLTALFSLPTCLHGCYRYLTQTSLFNFPMHRDGVGLIEKLFQDLQLGYAHTKDLLRASQVNGMQSAWPQTQNTAQHPRALQKDEVVLLSVFSTITQ